MTQTFKEHLTQETDSNGLLVIRMGDKCPACGKGPDVKYAGTGNLVLYHLPAECQYHAKQHRYKQTNTERTIPPTPYRED